MRSRCLLNAAFGLIFLYTGSATAAAPPALAPASAPAEQTRPLTVDEIFKPIGGGAQGGSASPAATPTVGDEAVSAASGTDVSFERDLFQEHDIALSGISATHAIAFTVPRNWVLTADPVVQLDFSHSPELLADLSSLTVIVNNVGVTSMHLTPENVTSGQVVAVIPRDLLGAYNRLSLVVDQHYTRDCEDPFNPVLWTRVSNQSTIRFKYALKGVNAALDEFPYPFYDDRAYGPLKLTFVLPDAPSPPVIDAVGRLAFAFGRLASYRGVELQAPVSRIEDARSAAIVVGTFDQMPTFGALLQTHPVSDGQGVVAVLPHPDDPTRPVLLVTGRTPEGVLNAALALAQDSRNESLTGPLAYVDAVTEGGALRSTQRTDLPVPVDRTDFLLSDLGFEDATVRGFYALPVNIPLTLEGDDLLDPSGGTIRLIYSYAANLNNDLSTLEVTLNDVSLKSVALDHPEGEQRAEIDVRVPSVLLTPRSTLRVHFLMYPRKFGACELVTDRAIWGTVWKDTALSLPRSRSAEVPDLALLRYRYWPFTASRAAETTWVGVGDDATRENVGAGAEMVARLGQVNGASGWPVRLGRAADVPADVTRRISLVTGEAPHARFQALNAAGLITGTGEEARSLLGAGANVLAARLRAGWRTVEEIASESGFDLILRGASAADNLRTASDLGDPKTLQALERNLAVLGDDQRARTLQLVKPHAWGEAPMVAARRGWMWWFVLGIPAIALVTFQLRRWAARRHGQTT